MTEDAGFTEYAAEDTPEGAVHIAPEQAAPAEPEPAGAVPEPSVYTNLSPAGQQQTPFAPPAPDYVPPPDHVPPPFIPDQGVNGWLKDALLELHRRLRNLGG